LTTIDLIKAIPTPYMLAGIAALVLASMGFGWVKGAHHEELKAAKFEAAIEAIGKAQAERTKEINARNIKLKEQADHENKRTIDSLRADIKRLRNERASTNFLPPAAPGASRPELACFDRTELERTLQQFDNEVTGLIAEGDEATVNLDTAKLWAQDR